MAERVARGSTGDPQVSKRRRPWPRKVFDGLEKLLEGACLVFLAATVVVVAWQVLARYVTSSSTAWAPELAQVTFVWLALCAIPIGIRHGRHMSIDAWFAVTNRRVEQVVTTVASLIVVVVSLVLAFYGYRILDVTFTRQFPGLGIAAGWMYLAVPVSFVLCAVFGIEAWWDQLRGDSLGDHSPTSSTTV